MHKKLTIYDLAEKLDFSPGTISRALSDHPAISQKTKGIIQAKAKELGYRSNKFAANLRKQKTNTIGVIVPRLNSHFMSAVLSGVEKVANEAGYSLIISQSLESESKEKINSKVLFNSGVDALLVSLAYDTDSYDHFATFIGRNIPLVFFDRVASLPGCTTILINNEQAGFEATEHLIQQGCQSILYVGGNLKRNVYHDRYEGFKRALKTYSLPFTDDLLVETDLNPQKAVQVVSYIKSYPGKIDGLFVANDTLAVRCIQELQKAGYHIPVDIKVVGFNNDPISEIISPTLTTIDYPGIKMGILAGQSIISHLEGNLNLQPTDSIVLRHKLIVRESSVVSEKILNTSPFTLPGL